jgi:hypothetical protein
MPLDPYFSNYTQQRAGVIVYSQTKVDITDVWEQRIDPI